MNEAKCCLFCKEPLSQDSHGNSDYCDFDCTYRMKLLRNKLRYQKDKELREAFIKSDELLQRFFSTYGGDQYIPAALLDQAGMEWLISKGEITIDKLPVKVLIRYGYCLFTNETVKIWKL